MKRALYAIEGNTQKLDGGSMFGNCPRAVWEKWIEADEYHRIPLACRALLVCEPERKVLLEAGIGAFFPPKYRERYGVVEEEHILLESLAKQDIKPADIDVVVLSHLHFDHAGGLLTAFEEDQEPALVFPNARYVVGREAWERANHPHPRDRASFIPELPKFLENSPGLELVEGPTSTTLGEGYHFDVSHGHTPGLLLTTVETPRGPVTFMGDLVPGTPWVHLPITMGYDRYPELLIDEKQKLLTKIQTRNGWCFFTHDIATVVSKVAQDAKGRWHAVENLSVMAWEDA